MSRFRRSLPGILKFMSVGNFILLVGWRWRKAKRAVASLRLAAFKGIQK